MANHHRLKMTPERVEKARALIIKPGWNMQRLAEKYRVSEVTIWRHVGGRKENLQRQTRKRR